ncbi:SGNH/GDSL hydrolase family protein [Nonomuraea africana]|uniref:SGNH/GDSL hydrolase family protein n=1 Tax=Nonomuraea africana TaxID=46171 RepID=UPI0033FF1E8D
MLRSTVVLSSAVLVALVGTPPVAAHRASAPGDVYVALGDSAAAGPLIPKQSLTQPGCLRSNRNYPALTAAALGVATFRDVSCSGATTADMYDGQVTPTGRVRPQLEAVTEDTTLVTLQIGGNDLKLTGLILKCLSLLPIVADPCADDEPEGGPNGWRARIDALAPKLDRLIRRVAEQAPRARIFVVGYATYLPQGGCYPRVPVLGEDATWVQGLISRVNRVLADQAAASGASYIDLETPSAGHDVCAARGVRWMEGYVPTAPAMPFHPNAAGMRAFADVVTAAIGDGDVRDSL